VFFFSPGGWRRLIFDWKQLLGNGKLLCVHGFFSMKEGHFWARWLDRKPSMLSNQNVPMGKRVMSNATVDGKNQTTTNV